MRKLCLVFAAFVLAWLPLAASAAEIVFRSGTKLEGTVISKDDKTMKVEVVVNGKPVTRSYPLSSVHSVTINGKLYVINEKNADTPAASGNTATEPRGAGTRTKAEVQKLIDTEGREPPELVVNDGQQLGGGETELVRPDLGACGGRSHPLLR